MNSEEYLKCTLTILNCSDPIEYSHTADGDDSLDLTVKDGNGTRSPKSPSSNLQQSDSKHLLSHSSQLRQQ